MVCTIRKSAPKRFQFQKPVPFPPRESADSIFHTNLYEARKSHNTTAVKCAQILSRAFPPTAHVSRLFLTIYTKFVYFSYASTWGVLGCFKAFIDTKCWISFCLLIIEAGKYMNVRCLATFWSGMLPVPL